MVQPLHIGVLASRRGHYGRTVLHGICDFARLYPHCRFRVVELSDQGVRTLQDWRLDGMIAFLQNTQAVDVVARLAIPTVNVFNWLDHADLPHVGLDDAQIGTAAAEHLLACGFEHFGFVGISYGRFSEERERGFVHALQAAGREPAIWKMPSVMREQDERGRSGRLREALGQWVLGLPKPVGIFGSFDEVAFEVTEVCRLQEIRVPEDVAVLGVDNDPLWCDLAVPPLSSIQTPAEQVGFKAAQQVETWIATGQRPQAAWLFPPSGVETRQSTDVLSIRDPVLSSALRFIREHACDRIGVEDVLDQVPLSRRAFERRFAQGLGRTPLEEIQRVRLDRVKQLLSNSDLSIASIADRTGFASAERLSVVFHAKLGLPPGAYRRQFRRVDAS